MATDSVGGEWCGPTRELENAQLVSLVHKTRKIVTEDLRVDIEVTPANEADEDEAVILVNKPPADAPVMGMKVDALPEATVLEIDEVICDIEPVVIAPEPRASSKSGSMVYPMHRDTLRPLRIMLLLLVLVIAAGVAVATMIV